MNGDNQKLRSSGDPRPETRLEPVDFVFLSAQTFADSALELDVLELFVAQARRILPGLSDLPPREQADTAHLLKGSARGIGAFAVADAADAYEHAAPEARASMFPDLARAFAAAEAAIAPRLAALRSEVAAS